MKNTSPAIDAYIKKSAPFSHPILTTLRRAFHRASPHIEETIKWGFPHFEYKGVVGSMAAFKQHVSVGFWKGALMNDPDGLFKGVGKTRMTALKITKPSELPSEAILVRYIKEAVNLNEQDVKLPRVRSATPASKLKPPTDLLAALKKNTKALTTFKAFSPSHKKEYIEWVAGAKQDVTRKKRIATAVEWMAEGKPHNWKYMKKK